MDFIQTVGANRAFWICGFGVVAICYLARFTPWRASSIWGVLNIAKAACLAGCSLPDRYALKTTLILIAAPAIKTRSAADFDLK
ncbi:MAG: hypothetical protein ACKVOT_11320, partial [Polaromonas sp.]